MVQWWKKFLDKLAEANKESFAPDQKLDCCSLNSSTKKQQIHKSK